MVRMVFQKLPLTITVSSLACTQVLEQSGTHTYLQIKISTKWDQLPRTLNGFVHGYSTGNIDWF